MAVSKSWETPIVSARAALDQWTDFMQGHLPLQRTSTANGHAADFDIVGA
jgi:hypothetical protein